MSQLALGHGAIGRGGGYRHDATRGARLGRLANQRRRELLKLPAVFAQVYARRLSRLVGAAVGVGVALLAYLLVAILDRGQQGGQPLGVQVFAAVWPVALGVGILVRLCGAALYRRRLRRWINARSYPERDIARLSGRNIHAVAKDLASKRSMASLFAPMALLALAMPLTIHGLASFVTSVEDFGWWMRASLVIVGHAHIGLAVLALRHAGEVAEGNSVDPFGLKALLITVGISAVPGIVLVFLPPIITFATGILFIPAMFYWAGRAAASERALMNQ